MKLKIVTTVFALVLSGSLMYAQSNTQSNSKQTTTTTTTKTETLKDSVYYTCSMHPDVLLSNPGKCPLCGTPCEKKTMKMTGTKTEKKIVTKSYSCSKHPEEKSDKPGKCPKCKMDMKMDSKKE